MAYQPNPGYGPPPPQGYGGGYGQPGYQPPPAGWQPPPPGYGQPQPGYQPPPPPPPVGYPAPHGSYGGGGGYGDPEGQKYGLHFNDRSIRNGFIRKVFIVVTLQMLLVVGFIALAPFSPGFKGYIRGSGSWLYWASYATFLITYIAIMCCEGVRKHFPGNVIALGLLTLAIAYMTAMISSFYDTEIVILAAGICACVCFAIILFASQTKYDFTSCMGIMFVFGMVVMFFGIFAIFYMMFGGPNAKFVYLIYAGLASLLFMGYLAIDVQMIMGGKKYEYSPEDWVMAATQLFIDLIYIFWFILQIVGAASNN